MKSTSLISNIIRSTIVFIIFSDHGRSGSSSVLHNRTDYASTLTGRSKRSLHDTSPNKLRLTIRYKTEEAMGIMFMKVSNTLANEYLPFYIPYVGFHPKVMTDIGDFVLYQDISTCSAVVYFGNFNTLYGLIGMDYYVQDLPFDFDLEGIYQSGIVSEPFIKKREHLQNHIHPGMVYPPPSDSEAWYDFFTGASQHSKENRKRSLDYESSSSTAYYQTQENAETEIDAVMQNRRNQLASTSEKFTGRENYKNYFLEILVFVTRDIAELFKSFFGDEQYIGWLGRYLIIYFNAVDSMFSKIKSTYAGVHINIAKIVIENENMPFQFVNNENLQFSEVVKILPEYLKFHADEYPQDSFDHVFIYTRRPIFDDVVEINGLTKHGKDMYVARKNDEFYNAVPISVVKFRYYYADFPVAVHEIGRILGLKIESQVEGLRSTGQCQGVMQREGPKCKECCKWSEASRIQFGVYFRESKNRCFLLNKPRSLQPPGTVAFSRANTQCQCFGYYSYKKYPSGNIKDTVECGSCNKPLECLKGDGLQLKSELTVLPFDGTPCARTKVCWDKKCIKLTINQKS